MGCRQSSAKGSSRSLSIGGQDVRGTATDEEAGAANKALLQDTGTCVQTEDDSAQVRHGSEVATVGSADHEQAAQGPFQTPKTPKRRNFFKDWKHMGFKSKNGMDNLTEVKQVISEIYGSPVVSCEDARHLIAEVFAAVHVRFRSDRDLVLAILAMRGTEWTLQHMSETLRSDQEVVTAALGVRFDHERLSDYVSFRLVVRTTRSRDHSVLQFVTNREVVKTFLQLDSRLLRFASDVFRDDTEVVGGAVQRDGRAFEFASERLRNDRQVVQAAVASEASMLKYAPQALRDDREFMKILAGVNGLVLLSASESLRNDREIVAAAILQVLAGESQGACHARNKLLACIPNGFWDRLEKEVLQTAQRNSTALTHGNSVAELEVESMSSAHDTMSAESFAESIGTQGYEMLPVRLQQLPEIKRFVGVKFDCIDLAKDTMKPILDYLSDITSAVSFYQAGRYQFLAAVAFGMLVNTIGSTVVVYRQRHALDLAVLNIVTFGLAGYLLDSLQAYSGGRKTSATKWLKFFEAIESFFSFGVNVYYLLISGFLVGFPKPSMKQACIRYFSISTSIVCLPMAISSYSVQLTKDAPRKFAKDTKWRSSAILHHAADLAFPLLVLVYQFFHRPLGIFLMTALYWLTLVVAFLCLHAAHNTLQRSDFAAAAMISTVYAPVVIPFTVLEVWTDIPIPEIRLLVVLRAVWVWFLVSVLAMQGYENKALLHQLLEPHVLPITVLIGICALMLPFTTRHQSTNGRWERIRQ
eukprot:TRINITY_DN16228_c0_g3_i1.p1 TRINITY_DN16228_c0_g3~~TRINITY_DN16228_c0_g3_i1.p1  ORF type:complete len:755 (+),score=72.42 TRINITY_DN16228_c0_g3_i1:104-2368(+)